MAEFMKKKASQLEKWDKSRREQFGKRACKACLEVKDHKSFRNGREKICLECRKISRLEAKYSRMLADDKKKKRYIGVDYITKEEFKKLALQPCTYCGSKESFGVDRVRNDESHTIGNCIPCCGVCNMARQNLFTIDEMKILGATIAQIKVKREDPNKKPEETFMIEKRARKLVVRG